MRRQIWIFVLAAVGCAVMLYPFWSDYLQDRQAASTIETCRQDVLSSGEEKNLQMLEEARAYNRLLASGQVILRDPFAPEEQEHLEEYNRLLRVSENGVMGAVRIPCIDVNLPVAHGTDSKTLERYVGHLSGTSLPVGGSSTHTVLTGHTGLSSARLFSDLIQMKVGDLFYIEVLGETMAYCVVDLFTVDPTDVSELAIEQGRDLATLLTCTPYGINTQRLLVRGERTEVPEETEGGENIENRIQSVWQQEYRHSLLAGTFFACLMFPAGRLMRRFRRNRTRGGK